MTKSFNSMAIHTHTPFSLLYIRFMAAAWKKAKKRKRKKKKNEKIRK